MSRLIAFSLIAGLGFAVGVILYYIGRFVGDLLKQALPGLFKIIMNPDTSGPIISGIVGTILAIILAYIWASKS